MTQRERQQLEDKIVRWTPRIVGVLCVVVVLLIGAAIYLSFKYQATNEQVDEAQQAQVLGLRESQYVNCIRSGNALRRQVRREFVDLKSDVLIPVFAGVAQTIPRGTPSRRILTGMVVYLHKRIRTIDHRIPNVDCARRYPPLDGQHFEQVRPDRNGGGDGRSTTTRPDSNPSPGSGGGPVTPGPSGSGDVGGGDGGSDGQPPTAPPSPPTPPTNPPTQPPPSGPSPPSSPSPSGPLDGVTAPLNDTIDHVQGTTNDAVGGLQQTVCNLPVALCP